MCTVVTSIRAIPTPRRSTRTLMGSARKKPMRRDASGSRRLNRVLTRPALRDGPAHRFDVTGRTDRLVTQVYFPSEPLNEQDQLLQRIRRKDAVIVRILPPTADLEPGSVIAAWDAVLSRG